jgi:hypothetical protein
MKKVLLVFFTVLAGLKVGAQSCENYPADCPSNTQLGDSTERFNNPRVPQEVSMELRLRDQFTAMMQQVADKKGWRFYEYSEDSSTGYLGAGRTGPLAYDLRPPHQYTISFIVITNERAFNAWKNWMNAIIEKWQHIDPQKFFTDTAMVTRMRHTQDSGTVAYRNQCMLRIKFEVNGENATLSNNTEPATIRVMGHFAAPGASLGIKAHNSRLYEKALFDLNDFTRATDIGFLLFGDWIPPNKYGLYYPAYNQDKKNIDKVTVKRIPCDRVRVMSMHVEGSLSNIDQFVGTLDTQKLAGMIVK